LFRLSLRSSSCAANNKALSVQPHVRSRAFTFSLAKLSLVAGTDTQPSFDYSVNMRFDTLLLAGTVSAAAANWPGETTVTVTVCETSPAPVAPTHTPSILPTPSVVPTPTGPATTTRKFSFGPLEHLSGWMLTGPAAAAITSPVHTPTVPAIPAPTAGAIPNQMKASMAGLLGFLIVGLAAL
jgi:hypothetical protein